MHAIPNSITMTQPFHELPQYSNAMAISHSHSSSASPSGLLHTDAYNQRLQTDFPQYGHQG